MSPSRPVLRWHGGKWLLAPWIIEHFPSHQVYVEPFGGAASVLMRKPRSYAEIYNDLDDEVVNLFNILRNDEDGEYLVNQIRLTPFSRAEFAQAYLQTDDEFERARRLIIRSFMGFGSNGHNRLTGFRANSNRSGTTPAHDWVNYPDSLSQVVCRLQGVTIEHKDAKAVMLQHDAAETLHYVDPPYVMDTRSDDGADYAHEMTDSDHADLLDCIRSLEGLVVLSGYGHPIYDRALSNWRRIEKQALADGAKPRTEVLWINPQCSDRLRAERSQLELLDGAA